jgi:mannose-6-phosphate isomerase-like protein (cupin superfamily)
MEKSDLRIPSIGKALKAGRIALGPGEEVGEHLTENREEIIIVLKGSGYLIRGRKEIPITEGEVHYVGENVRHNVRGGPEGTEYVYVVSMLSGDS